MESGLKAKHEKWGDIIPAFDVGGTHFDGLNLDTKGGADGDTSGQSILDALEPGTQERRASAGATAWS